jgi:hypothetical protein
MKALKSPCIVTKNYPAMTTAEKKAALRIMEGARIKLLRAGTQLAAQQAGLAIYHAACAALGIYPKRVRQRRGLPL